MLKCKGLDLESWKEADAACRQGRGVGGGWAKSCLDYQMHKWKSLAVPAETEHVEIIQCVLQIFA